MQRVRSGYPVCVSQERTNQKRRTRLAVLRSASEMLQAGAVPTVAEAAAAASVSRATAYRYFPSQDLLLVEATLEGATPAIDRVLASADFPQDAEARLDRLVTAVYEMLFGNEVAFRALLRLSLAPSPAVPVRRSGRRLAWLEQALAPIRAHCSAAAFKRLVSTLAVFLGVECVVVMRDICALPPRSAQQNVRWAARAILHAALAER